jgi:hypothetical protein
VELRVGQITCQATNSVFAGSLTELLSVSNTDLEYLTREEAEQIIDQFKKIPQSYDRLLFWTSIPRKWVQHWADDHGMLTLTWTMGSLMDSCGLKVSEKGQRARRTEQTCQRRIWNLCTLCLRTWCRQSVDVASFKAFGTCYEWRNADSRVESLEESIRLVIYHIGKNCLIAIEKREVGGIITLKIYHSSVLELDCRKSSKYSATTSQSRVFFRPCDLSSKASDLSDTCDADEVLVRPI